MFLQYPCHSCYGIWQTILVEGSQIARFRIKKQDPLIWSIDAFFETGVTVLLAFYLCQKVRFVFRKCPYVLFWSMKLKAMARLELLMCCCMAVWDFKLSDSPLLLFPSLEKIIIRLYSISGLCSLTGSSGRFQELWAGEHMLHKLWGRCRIQIQESIKLTLLYM